MTGALDTAFTAPPHWGWVVVAYFFFGGLAGGSLFLAGILELGPRAADRALGRLAYRVALVAFLPCPVLLVVDLTQPQRFWHMLLLSQRAGVIWKPWSPMSFGSWILLGFSAIVLLGFLAGRPGGSPPRTPLGWMAAGRWRTARAVAAAVFGLLLAGYTGVLLSVTNRPLWADTSLLGAVFLLSGVTGAVALLAWLGGRSREARGGLAFLGALDGRLRASEVLALGALVISLGPALEMWISGWGAALAIGTIGLGILGPLWLGRRTRHGSAGSGAGAGAAAFLTLLGGLVLRAVVVLSSEAS